MPSEHDRSTFLCLICTSPIEVTQMGVDACRACAAFFKRTMLAGRKYTCRQGNRQCAIRKNDKFSCRSCRLDKCIEYGMNYDNPQKRPPKKFGFTFMDNLVKAYKNSKKRRLAAEKKIVVMHKLERAAETGLYKIKINAFYECYRLTAKESITLIRLLYPNFNEQDVKVKASMLKLFAGKFHLIDTYYQTKKRLTGTVNYMFSLLAYLDCSDPSLLLSESDKEKGGEYVASVMRGFGKDYQQLVQPVVRIKEAITEREMFALHALAILDETDEVDEDTQQEVARLRSDVFEYLQNYYRWELNLCDYSKRLGNLMMIYHNACEGAELMREEYQMYTTMFNFLEEDDLLREILS